MGIEINKNNTRLYFIDYLRAIACSTVFIAHVYSTQLEQIHHLYKEKSFIKHIFFDLFQSGKTGVVIFFLISGFVIALTLEKKPTPKTYFIRRFFRIFPLFLLISFVLYGLGCEYYIKDFAEPFHGSTIDFIAANTLLFGSFINSNFLLDGVDWSLRAEELFYLVIGLLFYNNLWSFKKLALTMLLSLALTGIASFFNNIWLCESLIYLIICFLGTIYYLHYVKKITTRKLITTVAIIFAVFAIFDVIIKHNQPCFMLYLGIIVFSLMYIIREHIKPNKIIFFLSEITYPAYLLHSILFPFIKNKLLINNYLLREITTLLLFIAICFLIHKYIEKPFINLGKKLSA